MIDIFTITSIISLVVLGRYWAFISKNRYINWFTWSAAIFAPIGAILFRMGILVPDYALSLIDDESAQVYVVCFQIFILGTIVGSLILTMPSLRFQQHRGVTKVVANPLKGLAEREWSIPSAWLAYVAALVLSYAMGIVRFGSPLYFISADGSAFANSRELAQGMWFVLILSLFFVIPASILMGVLVKYNRPFQFVLVAGSAIVATITIGMTPVRTQTLALAAAAFAISRPFWKPMLFKIAAVSCAPVAILLMVALNIVRQGLAFDKFSFDTETTLLSLNPVINAIILVNSNYNDYFYFSTTLISMTPIVLIPSAIFPWKNYQDLQAFVTDVIFPELPRKYFSEGSVLTYTFVGGSYVNMGYVGLFVGGALWAVQIYIIMKLLNSEYPVKALAILLCITSAVSFRTSIESMFITIQLYTYSMLIIRFLCVKSRRVDSISRLGNDGLKVGGRFDRKRL
ncbi:hypothetical protein [Xanthobacter flavus]|uniref:hypothetical protein n=1 Tax=Xanthobacter flavus TaxID=281 RepID=UPI0037282121